MLALAFLSTRSPACSTKPTTWREIEEWLAAARVRSALAAARLGLMGHYYSGMLDIMTDVTLVSIAFGTHVEHA